MNRFLRCDYLALLNTFPLAKLRSEVQHRQALKVSSGLIGLARKMTGGEEKYLSALVVLIREYEQSRRKVVPPVSALDVLKHLMAEQGINQRQLSDLLGVGEAAASMILSGKRELTRSHIAALADHFGVGVSAFF